MFLHLRNLSGYIWMKYDVRLLKRMSLHGIIKISQQLIKYYLNLKVL